MWAIMKRRVKINVFATEQALEKEIKRIWAEITQEEINILVESSPHRVAKLAETNGENVQNA